MACCWMSVKNARSCPHYYGIISGTHVCYRRDGTVSPCTNLNKEVESGTDEPSEARATVQRTK